MTAWEERWDNSTRFLASAVHLDDRLADIFVQEYLTQPHRAIPPSPGVRAEIVLREAVAARSRRRSLNVALCLVFTLLLVTAFPIVFGWTLSAVSWRVCKALVIRLGTSQALARFGLGLTGTGEQWWATVVLWSASSMVWLIALVPVATVAGQLGGTVPAVPMIIGFVLLVPTMYVTLVGARYLPWGTALSWYSIANFDPDAPIRARVAKVCARYTDRLRLIANDDLRRIQSQSDEVIVFRGRKPFVGAGPLVRNWSAAFELRHAKSTPAKPLAVPQFQPSGLQDHVAAELEKLRKPENLTPGWRFRELEISRWAIVSAAQLPLAPDLDTVMRQLTDGVRPTLPEPVWRDLADGSPEWLRFYRCYRIEGWSRGLTVAGYLHVGCEERMLVLEWNAFVLPPVAAQFCQVDSPPTMLEARCMVNALSDLALLPTTMPTRVTDIVRSFREVSAAGNGYWRTPAEASVAYGAAASIRELAAAATFTNYFQQSDSDRYLKILERRVLDSVSQFLAAREIVAVGFDQVVTQINNSTIINNSNVIAGSIGGQDNTGEVSINDTNSGGSSDSGVD
ncbi:hypothetical protein ACFROC_29950 [Nocardia tengchongensis]|uniref:hypothetical protein n=1 Tax=Nocardia tengchongensis TaxID=2055889 RepID=UPI00369E4931